MTSRRDDSVEFDALRIAVDAWAEEYKALYLKHGECKRRLWSLDFTLLDSATEHGPTMDALATVLREAFERKMGG